MSTKKRQKPQSHPDIPISEDTYRNMIRLGWCYKCANGIVRLTPLGETELLKAIQTYKQEPEIRPEWLAPD